MKNFKFQISPTKFEELLKMVARSITDSSMKREAISAEERLCITLRYLGSGGSYLSLASQYQIGVSILATLWLKQHPKAGSYFPNVFIGGDAFPLRTNLIKLYANSNLNVRKFITTNRISRTRRIIENTFGILTARFRIFRRPILAKIDNVISITKACLALHNFLMPYRKSNSYFPDDFAAINFQGKRKPGH